MRAATQVSADVEAVPIVGRAFGHAGRRARSTLRRGVAHSADNFTHHTDIGTGNSAFPKGKLLLVVAAAVATAPLERHDRTGTNGQELPVADTSELGTSTPRGRPND